MSTWPMEQSNRRRTALMTVFGWTDGYTNVSAALDQSHASLSGVNQGTGTPENCLSASRIYGTSQTINDVPCDDTRSQWGVVCGYQLI
ncbi:Protein CBG25635 [Caenorhabditis briggsae]|uniref:Protein CBG25635 n=1 Tax=Caenorhabditis briggsae TaxID=6238 RepID=B6IFB9_CAEBR|nr:Protein CBG25635 [Caenorhabditis briggsae]CAR98599.1 Protein CBG25635 [Caenorhabditis briggsae]